MSILLNLTFSLPFSRGCTAVVTSNHPKAVQNF